MQLENKIVQFLLFILIFIGIYWFWLNFQNYLFLNPCSHHFIRQTDSLAFIGNYLNDFNFWNPKTYDLHTSLDGGTASEFPILYYINALLFKVFGKKLIIPKLTTLCLSFIAAYSLFTITNTYLKNFFLAVSYTFALFCSCVYFYYVNTFIPDINALNLLIIGTALWINNLNDNKRTINIIAYLLVVLASLIKITFLILPLSFLLLKLLNKYLKITEAKYLNFKIADTAIILLPAIWILFVKHYNTIHQNTYFLTSIKPIWNLNSEQIHSVLDSLTGWFGSEIYPHNLLYIFYGFAFFFLISFKKNSLLHILTLITTMGSIAYFLLFFEQFKHHDYYLFALLPSVILLTCIGLQYLSKNIKSNAVKISALLIFVFFILQSYNKTKQNLNTRYSEEAINNAQAINNLIGGDVYLDNLNIPKDAKIIVLGDYTCNASLFYLNRQGYTFPHLFNYSVQDMNTKITVLAKNTLYIVVVNEKLKEKIKNQNIFLNQIGTYSGNKIFKYTPN